MSYLHIPNLYKEQTILLFKECYAMEKIHGTSTHIGWKFESKDVRYSSGGESNVAFAALFNKDFLKAKFIEIFPDIDVVIFGEAYGGKQQGQSHVYGKDLRFIGFDVKVGDNWLNVPNAEDVCRQFHLEFVFYELITVTLKNLTDARDAFSKQAFRNGITEPKKREGVVLRPLIEMKTNNDERVICKYKPDEQTETKTKREVTPEQVKVLEDAKAIAEEWVTNLRLEHVLQKLSADISMEGVPEIIKAMIEDVYREGKGEIIESREATKAIGNKTVQLFKQKLNSKLEEKECPKSPTGKHEYALPPDSFDNPYCKYCYKGS